MALIRLDRMAARMTNQALEAVMKAESAEDLTDVHMGGVTIDVETDNKIIIMGKMDLEAKERTPLVKRVVQLEMETNQSVGKAVLVVMIATSNVDDLSGAHIDVVIIDE